MSECNECNEKYKCEWCGKTFGTPQGLRMHQRTCKMKPEDVIVENVEVDLGDGVILTEDPTLPYVDPTQMTKLEPDMNEQIKAFFSGLGARPLRGRYDIETLFGFFKWLNPKSTLLLDWRCSHCVQQIYRKVQEYYEKIK